MNRALAQAIVACLGSAPESRPPARLLQPFNLRDWERALRWLDLSGLALYFWRRLKDSGTTDAIPLPVRLRLERNLSDNQQRVADAAKEFFALNKLWEQAGARFAALKGFALVPDYCREAALRTQYDHDYLLDTRSIPAAEAALRSAGYGRKNPHESHPLAFTRSHFPAPPPTGPFDFYARGLPRAVELHTRLWEAADERIDIPGFESALNRVRRRQWGGEFFPALDDTDALVFQTLHAFRHILRNWCRLSIFLEIARFLERRAADLDFWERYRSRVENQPWLPQVSGVVLSLASNLFSVPLPEPARPMTSETLTPAMSRWIERYGGKSALGNFQGNKYSLFLHREFIKDAAAWREVRRRRLWPLAQVRRALVLRPSGTSSFCKAAWMQGIHVARRVSFHLTAAIGYALAWPFWSRRIGSHAGPSPSQRAKRGFGGPVMAVRYPKE